MVPVCYSGNRKIFEGLLLSVMSLAKYTQEELNVYILTMDLHDDNPNFLPFTDEQISILDMILKEKNKKSKAIKVDVTELYKKYMLHGKNHNTGYTPYTLLRLLIDKMPNIPQKMLYLDIDTMLCNDIKQLYDVDVEGYDVGMVKDYMGRFWIRPSYCNAGVLVLNIPQMLKNNTFEKCRDMVVNKKMLMSDQTALNKHAHKKYLPFKFNEQRKIKKETVVKHFCKGIVFFLPFGFHIYNIKQWQRDKVHKSLKIFMFDDLYDKVDILKNQYNCF